MFNVLLSCHPAIHFWNTPSQSIGLRDEDAPGMAECRTEPAILCRVRLREGKDEVSGALPAHWINHGWAPSVAAVQLTKVDPEWMQLGGVINYWLRKRAKSQNAVLFCRMELPLWEAWVWLENCRWNAGTRKPPCLCAWHVSSHKESLWNTLRSEVRHTAQKCFTSRMILRKAN